MKAPAKPLPLLDHDSKPFWDGCARGELLLQRCLDCGAYRHPPSPICSQCLSAAHEWTPASGQGTIYTFVVVHRAFHPAWEAELPYVVAIIELAEGPHIMSNITNVPVDAVQVDMPVKVWFDEMSDEISLPKFMPLNAMIERDSERRLARLGGTEPSTQPVPRRRSDAQ